MPVHTRRDLLRGSLLLAGASGAPRLWGALTTTPRSYTAGRFCLFINGAPAPAVSLTSTEIAPLAPTKAPPLLALPPPTAAISQAAVSASALQTYPYQLSIEFGELAPPAAAWVAAAVNHAAGPLPLSFGAYDFNYNGVDGLDWTGCIITQVVWPGCDAGSTAPLSPVAVTALAVTQIWHKGAPPYPPLDHTYIQKAWRASDFRVTSNMNITSATVAGVSPLTFMPAIRGGSVNFAYNLPAAMAVPLLAPFDSAWRARGGVLVPGQSTDYSIQYLTPDLSSVRASVMLQNCTVVGVNVGPLRSMVTLAYADASLTIASV